jgi:hypothetical protein
MHFLLNDAKIKHEKLSTTCNQQDLGIKFHVEICIENFSITPLARRTLLNGFLVSRNAV